MSKRDLVLVITDGAGSIRADYYDLRTGERLQRPDTFTVESRLIFGKDGSQWADIPGTTQDLIRAVKQDGRGQEVKYVVPIGRGATGGLWGNGGFVPRTVETADGEKQVGVICYFSPVGDNTNKLFDHEMRPMERYLQLGLPVGFTNNLVTARGLLDLALNHPERIRGAERYIFVPEVIARQFAPTQRQMVLNGLMQCAIQDYSKIEDGVIWRMMLVE